MDNLSGYANRPFPFVLRYLRKRLAAHFVIFMSVVAAVVCSVCTQYGVKFLVDGLSGGPAQAGSVWLAFALLISLIAADNFLWRIASWIASFTFVRVTGDLRRDIFRHLTGQTESVVDLLAMPDSTEVEADRSSDTWDRRGALG